MELVPGKTLAEIMSAEGALAPAVAVHIAGQIAEALEAAHEQNIVHRDLKPANIKRRDDDVVKVLDFGLARAFDPAAASGSDALTMMGSSPTMMSPAVTQHGVILGTAGYMSPEQAKGRAPDKRADIWAFGVVLYEMLTGRPLFEGDTITEVIAAVIKDAPSLDALPPQTPPALRHLIARCLERDPKLRLRDIGEARIALRTALDPADPLNRTQTVSAVATASASAAHGSRTMRVALAAGAIALAGLAAVVAWRAKPEAAGIPVRRFDLPAAMVDGHSRLAPDGSRLAYFRDGHLFVYALETATSTDLGNVPPAAGNGFWSPDGRTIGYWAESSLRTVPVSGGVPFTVCKVPASGQIEGALWQDDGTIQFIVWRDSLYRVPATGGTPALVAAIDPKTEVDFHGLTSLPNNRLILTTHLRGEDRARLDLVDGGKRTPLSTDPDLTVGNVAFMAPNHLLFLRAFNNPGVWDAPFDGTTVDFTKATLIAPHAVNFDASPDGTMIVQLAAKEPRELAWVTSKGDVSAVPGAPFEWVSRRVALSPDSRRAVLSERGPDEKEVFVVRNVVTGTDTRLALPEAYKGLATGAIVNWMPSGRLLFAAGAVEQSKIYDWPADGSSNGRELVPGLAALVTPDHKEVIFNQDVRSIARLQRAPILPDGSAGTPQPLFSGSQPDARYFDLSPDGKLLAFTVADANTRQTNVFVATYPGLSERLQVTSNGGTGPRFSRDGKLLYYLTGTRVNGTPRGQLYVVPITTAPLDTGASTLLFTEGEGVAAGERALSIMAVETASDGRLLMTRRVPTPPSDQARLMLLQNWMGGLRK